MTGESLYLSLCLSTTTSSKPLQHNDYQMFYGGFTFINFFESQEKTCHVFLPSLPLNNRLWPMSQLYWIRCIFCTCKLILHRVVWGVSVLVQEISPRWICFHHEHLESLCLPSNPSLFFFGESLDLGLLFTRQISNGTEVKVLCTPVNNIYFGDTVRSLPGATHVLGCHVGLSTQTQFCCEYLRFSFRIVT